MLLKIYEIYDINEFKEKCIKFEIDTERDLIIT
jgi:hypothetical protein